jgi:hypothetical protein
MLIVIIWVLFGIASVIVASQKGRSKFAWFFLGVLLGPFGLLFIILLSSVNIPSNEVRTVATINLAPDEIYPSQKTKKCPQCAETIKFRSFKMPLLRRNL